jgi:hypothetical protein
MQFVFTKLGPQMKGKILGTLSILRTTILQTTILQTTILQMTILRTTILRTTILWTTILQTTILRMTILNDQSSEQLKCDHSPNVTNLEQPFSEQPILEYDTSSEVF